MMDEVNVGHGKIRSLSFLEDNEEADVPEDNRSSVADLRARLHTTLDVYFLSLEVNEAVETLQKLAQDFPSLCDELVASMVRHVLDKSTLTGQRITEILVRLKSDQTLGATALVRGFAKLVYTWEDLVLDAPKAGCALVCMVLDSIQKGCLEQNFLPKLPEALLANSLKGMDEDADGRNEVQETIEGLRAFKQEVKAIGLQRKWSVDRAEKKLKRLGKPQYNFEFVRQALVCALEGSSKDAEKCVDMLEDLCSLTALCPEDLCWGTVRLLGSFDDLELDLPSCVQKASTILQLLVEVGLLTNGFVKRCRRLRIGGARGVEAMEAVWQATPQEPENGAAMKAENGVAEAEGNALPESVQQEKIEEKANPATGGDAVSLRPGGGGASLRPGGGGVGTSFTGGAFLRPGGGAGMSLTGGVSLRPGGCTGGSLTGKVSTLGPPQEVPKAPNEVPENHGKGSDRGKGSGYLGGKTTGMESDDWRARAAEKQQRQRNRRGGDGRRDRREKRDEAAEKGETEQKEQKEQKEKTPKDAPPKLVSSENSWAAMQKRRKEEEATAVDSDEQITRNMKSILNKITLEKFDELFQQLTQCGICKERHVEILIAEVFEKATTQHHFAAMYCKLCVLMSEWCKKTDVGSVKSILLLQCQTSFEANLKPPEDMLAALAEPGAAENEEVQERQLMYKRRMFGNIKLVGLLLCAKMVASKVLIACSEELLAEKSTEALESLALLLTTTGPAFDKSDWSHHSSLRALFMQVEKMARDKSLPARSRFLLQDLLDLRASGWVDNKIATKRQEGPKKLKEVAEPEEVEKDDGWTAAGPVKKLQKGKKVYT